MISPDRQRPELRKGSLSAYPNFIIQLWQSFCPYLTSIIVAKTANAMRYSAWFGLCSYQSMARLSGLQREVLSLYRKCLREIRKKPSVSASGSVSGFCHWSQTNALWHWSLRRIQGRTSGLILGREHLHVISFETANICGRKEFEKHRTLNKKDFNAIEYLLRKGHRQFEMYSSPGIRNIR